MKEIRDIEWLLNWAFEAQKVETAIKLQTPKAPNIASSAILQLLELGVRVDSSSAGERWGSARCHDDAVIIYEMVARLPKEAMGLVILHARAGTRPDWCAEGVGCEVPVLTRTGKPKRIYRDPIKCRGDLGPMMKWQGLHPESVEFHRAQYSVWHLALEALVEPLNKELTNYRASYAKTHKEPWITGLPVEIRITV